MQDVMLGLRKHSILLALLLSLFFVVGITCAPVVLAAQNQVEKCCDHDAAPEAPVEGGDCFDCNCLACVVGLSSSEQYASTVIATASSYTWLYDANFPSGFIRSIDYPPEVL